MNKSYLILCNRSHPIPREYDVTLHTLPDGQQIDARILPAYEALTDALNAQGFRFFLCSAYRTWQAQEKVMQEKIDLHLSEGHTPEEAKALAERIVAIPGTSEHQLGLAVDILPAPELPDDGGLYAWLAENAHRFGFILRYPADKTHITQIDYEPWHFRYVGLAPALDIYQRRCCLEEYLGQTD